MAAEGSFDFDEVALAIFRRQLLVDDCFCESARIGESAISGEQRHLIILDLLLEVAFELCL